MINNGDFIGKEQFSYYHDDLVKYITIYIKIKMEDSSI